MISRPGMVQYISKWILNFARSSCLCMLFFGSGVCFAQVQVPLFAKYGLPHCKVTVQDQTVDAFVDFGSTATKIDTSAFPHDAFVFLPEYCRMRQGIAAEERNLQKVEIRHLKIDSCPISPLIAVNESKKIKACKIDVDQESEQEVHVEPSERILPLTLGLSAWQRTPVLLDLSEGCMTLYEPEESYLNQVRGWIECPFEYKEGCIAIQVSSLPSSHSDDSAFFVLDTGCSINAVQTFASSAPILMKKVELEKVGLQTHLIATGGNFYEINRILVKGAKGILGIPFFIQRPVLIDCLRRKVFFPPDHV